MRKYPSPKKRPSVCFVSIPVYHIFANTESTPTGGAEFSLHERATHLSPDYDVSIVTGDFGQPSVMNMGNVTLYSSVRLLHTSQIRNLFLLWRALRQASADIYIKSDFGKIIFPIWLFCKIHRKKFIYLTASDDECNGKNIQRFPLFGLLCKIALEHADYIVTSVKHHRIFLTKHHPRITCPVEHIYHGLTLPEEEKPREKKTILWLARCDPWKNPFIFIELAKRFPREHFTMIAAPQPGKKKLFDQVEQAAKQCKNITFIPGVPHDKTQEFFNTAKISVNTSDFEGFSMAFIQSGIGKTPILTLNLNPDQIITEHKLGYCAKGNFEQMVEQLRTILSNPRDLEQKAENIARYMRENHDIKKVVRTWEALFTNVMHKQSNEEYIYASWKSLLVRSLQLDIQWMQTKGIPQKYRFILKKYIFLLASPLFWNKEIKAYSILLWDRNVFLESRNQIGIIQSTCINQAYLQNFIKPGGIVIDVGAHIGEFALVSEVLLGASSVHSFEPIRESYTLLARNKKNDTHNVAIGKKSEFVMYIPPHQSLMASGYSFYPNEKKQTVQCIELDTTPAIQNLASIDLFKIDVEGMEYDVLLASKETIKKARYILMEGSIDRPATKPILTTLTYLRTIAPEFKLIHIGQIFGNHQRTDSVDLLFRNTTFHE